MIREDIKKKSLILSENNKILALQFATGVGKSKVALDILLNNWQKLPNTSTFKALIVIAELAHYDNWKDEAIKWNHQLIWEKITIVTYASLKKHKDLHYNFIILDEAHHIGSDIRLDIIDNIQFDKMLLLSATLGESLCQSLSALFNSSIVTYNIDLQQAIDWELLPIPKIFLIQLRLNYLDCTEIIIEEWGKKDLRKTIMCKYDERWNYLRNKAKFPNVTLKIQCTPYQKYAYLCSKFEYYKKLFFRTQNMVMKNKWLQIGSQRKRFLGELKTKEVQRLLQKIKTKRFICFCASIEQADILGKQNAIHSKKDNSLEIIDNFNSNKIDNLFAVGMLQEGQNLNNIEVGIIVQLDGGERPFIQKFGRSLRAIDPVQYIFYYKNTRDEEYLNAILEGINSEYVQELTDYEDIN